MKPVRLLVCAALMTAVSSAGARDVPTWLKYYSNPSIDLLEVEVIRFGTVQDTVGCSERAVLVDGSLAFVPTGRCILGSVAEVEVVSHFQSTVWQVGDHLLVFIKSPGVATAADRGMTPGSRGLLAAEVVREGSAQDLTPTLAATAVYAWPGGEDEGLDPNSVRVLVDWAPSVDALAELSALQRGPAFFRVDEPTPGQRLGAGGFFRAAATVASADSVRGVIGDDTEFEFPIVAGVASGSWQNVSERSGAALLGVEFLLSGEVVARRWIQVSFEPLAACDDFSVRPGWISMPSRPAGAPGEAVVSIHNATGDLIPLQVEGVGDASTSTSSIALPGGGEASLAVLDARNEAGQHSGLITVRSASCSLSVPLSATVFPATSVQLVTAGDCDGAQCTLSFSVAGEDTALGSLGRQYLWSGCVQGVGEASRECLASAPGAYSSSVVVTYATGQSATAQATQEVAAASYTASEWSSCQSAQSWQCQGVGPTGCSRAGVRTRTLQPAALILGNEGVPPPSVEEACTQYSEGYVSSYSVGSWGACSSTCGGGQQTRSVAVSGFTNVAPGAGAPDQSMSCTGTQCTCDDMGWFAADQRDDCDSSCSSSCVKRQWCEYNTCEPWPNYCWKC